MSLPPVRIGKTDHPCAAPTDLHGTGCECRTIAEIDCHLVGLRIWRDHQLRSIAIAPPRRREQSRARIASAYAEYCNLLLDRRLVLPG